MVIGKACHNATIGELLALLFKLIILTETKIY